MKRIFFAVLFALVLISAGFSQDEPLIITYFERPPYYINDNGYETGFLIDYVRRVMDDTEINYVFFQYPSARIMSEIQKPGNYICSIGWFKTADRETFAKFTLPIYQNKPVVLLIKSDNINNFDKYTDLSEIFLDQSMKIGLIAGFSYGAVIDQLILNLAPQKEVIIGDQYNLIRMLERERFSYMLLAPEEVNYLIESAGLNPDNFTSITLSDIPSGNKRYIICNQTVSDEVIQEINRSILRNSFLN